ncbi:chalcone isomerase family protein [Roseateles sp. P5_E7]
MRRRAVLISFAAVTLAQAAPELTGLMRRGQARFRFLGLHVYDIRLWSAAPITAANWQEQPLTLEIEYARSLDGAEIAKRSLKEMRRQATVSDAQAQAWLAEMQAAFPDVKAGDRISGSHEPGVAVQFFVNGQPRRRVADATFARLFLGIWLSPQTSEPALREQLLASDGKP